MPETDRIGDPDDGHQFHFTVHCQGSSAVRGQPHTDDTTAGDPFRVTVRAWSLTAACEKAAKVPFAAWLLDGSDDDEWLEDAPPDVVKAHHKVRQMRRAALSESDLLAMRSFQVADNKVQQWLRERAARLLGDEL